LSRKVTLIAAIVTQTVKPRAQKIVGEEDFYDSINEAIKTTRHKGSLLMIIKEFEKYKEFMLENIAPAAAPVEKIFTFKFTYQLMPKVWKEVEIYGDQTLETLAGFIIEEMNWWNDHAHAYFFGEKHGKVIFSHWYTLFEIGSSGLEHDQYPIIHTDEVLVSSIDYEKQPKLGFVFDFGDDHRFLMEYKGSRLPVKQDDWNAFPRLTDQRGVAPEQYPNYID
jgi:hypothetical protein